MTSPALLSVSSSNNTTITLHFDRAVSSGDGRIVVSDGSSQTYVSAGGLSSRIIGATDSRVLDSDDSQLSYSGQDIVIHLSSPLQNGLGYSITMSSGAVTDGHDAGNASISSTRLFSFVATGSASVPATPAATVGSTIHFTDTGVSTDYVTASLEQTVSGTYSGTLGANDFVQVSLDNGASWHKATAGSGNTWSYSGSIDTGNLTEGSAGTLNGALLARVSNLAGGTSATASHSYVYNNHPIEINIGYDFTFSADTGSDHSDLITNTAAQTISGTYSGNLISGQTLQVSVDDGATWVNASASNGSWHTTGTVSLLSGSHEVQARVIDAAGNTSGVASADYQLLTTAVSLAGHALTLPSGSDTGASASDGITKSAQKVTLDVAGVHGLHAGDTIQIVDANHSSAVVGSYVIQSGDLYYGSDYFSVSQYDPQARSTVDITLDTVGDGSYTLAARILDVAGNSNGAASTSKAITIDNTAPTVSTRAPVEGASSVSTGLDKLTFTFNEKIAIANGTVVYITDDDNPNNYQEVTLSSSAASDKTLTINLGTALTTGTHYTVQGAVVSDLAGNVGITGDTPMLHFTTAGSYGGASQQTFAYVDTAPASAAANSPLHTDGITSNNVLTVQGLTPQSSWYYRTSASDTWHEGGLDQTITLEDGSYAMDSIQVRQTLNGPISSFSTALVVDTQPSTAVVAGGSFRSGDSSISGAISGSTDLSNEIVEVSFDHGVHWTKATTTFVSAGAATWTLSGTASDLGTSYGLRLSDQAGNITAFAGQSVAKPAYYLTSEDNGFDYPDEDNLTVIGGNGSDAIKVGDHAIVIGNSGGGAGDFVQTGSDAIVTVANNSTVITGDGNNLVSTGFGATITTGSGDDVIAVSVVSNAVVHAGAGNDTLNVNVTSTLVLDDLNVTGVESFVLGGSGANDLTIRTAAAMHSFADGSTLTITANGSSSHLHLSGLVWTADGTVDGYHSYHAGSGEILLVGLNITVDTLLGSA